MIEIRDLHVEIFGREVLKGINITIPDGETHILFGPNGSGKTSLLMTIMGYPQYKITKGSISFNSVELNSLPIDERSKAGIGLFFQRPPSIKGIKLSQMTDIIRAKSGVKMDSAVAAKALHLGYLMDRDINHGFSGGEIKRSELLQLMAQKPSFVLFDEPESGVDLENMQLIGKVVRRLLDGEVDLPPGACAKPLKCKLRTSGLIITHTGYILEYINADRGQVMYEGKLCCESNPRDILDHISRFGYQECLRCLA